MAYSGGGCRSERGAAGGRGAGHPHRRAQRLWLVVDIAEKADQVGGEIVRRAAGGGDVNEAKQGRSKLVVARREIHRALVERPDRMAAVGGEGLGELAADELDLTLQRP